MAKSKSRKKNPPKVHNSKAESYRNTINRLHELCQMIDCDVMHHITTPEQISRLCRRRFRLGNVTEVKSDYTNKEYKTMYSKRIKHLCTIPCIPIDGLTKQICYKDLTYIWALKTYIEKDDFDNPELNKKYLQQISVFLPDDEAIFRGLVTTLRWLTIMENLPNEPHISFDFGLDKRYKPSDMYLCSIAFTLNIQKPLVKHLVIDEHKRPVYRLFVPFEGKLGNYTALVDASELGQLYNGNHSSLPVYIQGHAIQRFKERLEIVDELTRKLFFNSFIMLKPNLHIKCSKVFLHFYLSNIRVGYFVAEIINHKVVIKTFILATHASAPEGSLFQNLTGFEKQDMSYWNIEKLETFIYNTIEPDNPLYIYFEQSQLLPLFNLTESLILPSDIHKKEARWDHMAQCLTKYYQMDSLSHEEIKGMNKTILAGC